MVDVQLLHFAEVTEGFLLVSYPCVAKGKHEEAVYAVLQVKVAIPYLQVRQGNGELVHRLFLEDVLFAIVNQLVETAIGLFCTSQFL